MELLQHQKDAVKKLDNGKILYGGVGTGKTRTALAYYMEREAPKDIYVISTAKHRDSLFWQGNAAQFGIGMTRDSTVAGILTVDSWNNISKYTDIENSFFIFDEQRLVGSGAWVKSFLKIVKRNRWILLTATPGDVWMDYAAVFIANGFFRNITQFKDEHVVYAPFSRYPKIVRYTHVSTLEKYRNILLVEMPYLKHTVRVTDNIITEYDTALFKKVFTDRWHVYEDRPIKDAAEMFRVMRRIINTDPSKLEALKRLMEDHPRIIVFYQYDYELEILRTLSEIVTVGEWNGHRKNPIPDTEKWVYLVQYIAGAEGWNCTSTDTMVFYSLTYSYKNFEQAQGRIDRLDTPWVVLSYFIFVSKSVVDRAIYKSLVQKHLFNERKWAYENLTNDKFQTFLDD